MIARIESTPIAKAAPAIPKGTPRRIDPNVLAAVLPGPGRDRLAAGEVRVVTTGQQPGLFTGPLYTINKALSAIALAARLERERGVPVVPVFWVAGDDHDFAEGNHAWVLNGDGEPVKIVLRERPHDARQLPLFREPCGPEIRAALDALNAALPETEFKRDVITWLESTYRPETSLADAAANALHQLLAARGLAIFRAYDPAAERAAAPWLAPGGAAPRSSARTPRPRRARPRLGSWGGSMRHSPTGSRRCSSRARWGAIDCAPKATPRSRGAAASSSVERSSNRWRARRRSACRRTCCAAPSPTPRSFRRSRTSAARGRWSTCRNRSPCSRSSASRRRRQCRAGPA